MRATFLCVALLSSTLVAQERATPLQINFTASAESFGPATKEYTEIWAGEGPRIVAAMERATTLRFEAGPIAAVVYEGASFSGSGARPMYLRASYSPATKRATLVHELGHRLMGNLVPPGVDHHSVIFLFVYDVWVELWGQPFADEQVAIERKRKGLADYEGLWRQALELSATERASRFRRLVQEHRNAMPVGPAQSSPPRPRLTGISHVAFRVSDTGSARRFYGDLLGLTERASSGDDVRIAYAVGPRQRVLLEPGLPAGEDERLSHIALETPDVNGLAAYLTSRGVQILKPSDRCQDNAIRVTDPDGHAIEFVQVNWPPEARLAEPGRALSSRLLHAGITVRDEQAAHRFYRDTLGFSEIWRGGRTEGATDWVNMRIPDGTEYLEYMLVTTAPDRRQRGVLHHVCLLVPDIQSAWETVVTRTAQPMRSSLAPPSVGRNGRWQLNLFDPDGTRAELMEPFTIR